MNRRPVPALSDLSVTEFLTLSRMGYLPHGLVIGSSVYDAGVAFQPPTIGLGDALAAVFANKPVVAQAPAVQTGEVAVLSQAMRAARHLAIGRMKQQAADLGAEGVVGVRLQVEHHTWRGGREIAKFLAIGTAIGFDPEHAPEQLRHAPSLRLTNGHPFASDLSGQDFVALLRAGYRPVSVATGTCVYQLDVREAARYAGHNAEIGAYTQAFFDARETAMARLQGDLFGEFAPGHPDAPMGIVGMTVAEGAYGGRGASGPNGAQKPPIVEFTAIGTAVAHLAANDPRRAGDRPKPTPVVPLDR